MAKGRKTGGRTKNSLNKVTGDLKVDIAHFLQNNFQVVVEEWNNLESGKDKLNFYKDLLKYSVSPLQSVPEKSEVENESQLNKSRLFLQSINEQILSRKYQGAAKPQLPDQVKL
jgi:hypothetical protein